MPKNEAQVFDCELVIMPPQFRKSSFVRTRKNGTGELKHKMMWDHDAVTVQEVKEAYETTLTVLESRQLTTLAQGLRKCPVRVLPHEPHPISQDTRNKPFVGLQQCAKVLICDNDSKLHHPTIKQVCVPL